MLLPVLQMANGQQFLQIRPFLAVQVLATASLSLSIFWTYFPAIVAAMFATLVTFQQFVHITQLWPDFTLLTISNNFGRILNFHPDFTMYNSLFWHSSINFDHISEYYFKQDQVNNANSAFIFMINLLIIQGCQSGSVGRGDQLVRLVRLIWWSR